MCRPLRLASLSADAFFLVSSCTHNVHLMLMYRVSVCLRKVCEVAGLMSWRIFIAPVKVVAAGMNDAMATHAVKAKFIIAQEILLFVLFICTWCVSFQNAKFMPVFNIVVLLIAFSK